MKKLILFTLSALLFAGCVLNPTSSRPEWINNPGDGVSASADMHALGRHAQEALAIKRAREEYARRYGVNIKSITELKETITNDQVHSKLVTKSTEKVNSDNIKAIIKQKWLEPGSSKLWVWLVPY
jgi:hypothetical protein